MGLLTSIYGIKKNLVLLMQRIRLKHKDVEGCRKKFESGRFLDTFFMKKSRSGRVIVTTE